MSSGLNDMFNMEVLHLHRNLKTKEQFSKALSKMEWTLNKWDENPLKDGIEHPMGLVYAEVTTSTRAQKKFLILRQGNSATIGVIKHIDEEPHIMIRKEQKGTGIDITTMPSGYANKDDENIADTAIRKLFEESSIKPKTIHALRHPSAPLSNNSTNTSTSFIAEVKKDYEAIDGYEFTPLKRAAFINHGPAQTTALLACAYYKIIPDIDAVNIPLPEIS